MVVSRWSDRRVLLLVLLGLALLKLSFNPRPDSDVKADDGAYYYQIARNVAEGRGLTTNVSVFHHGFATLPHPITYYPLWVAMLGLAGRAIGLARAAQWLPEALYFTALLLLYALALRIGRVFDADGPPIAYRHTRVDWPTRRAAPLPINLGHVAVLLFALNPVFFRFTSVPFTEALAFTALFGTMLLALGTIDRPSVAGALLTGLLAGSCYLVRAQLVFAAVLVPALFAWYGRRRDAALALAGACVPVGLWVGYILATVTHFSPGVLLDPAATREFDALTPYAWQVATPTFGAFVLDRLPGLVVAFNPLSRFSFFASFGPAVYLVPIGALAALLSWRRIRASARDVAAAPVVLSLIIGLACVAPVFLMHEREGDWFFQFRYGLPLILPLVVAIGALVTRSHWARLGTIALLLATLVFDVPMLARVLRSSYPPVSAQAHALARWIAAQPTPPILLSTHPSTLSAETRGLFHQWTCWDPIDQVRAIISHGGVTHVLVYPDDTICEAFAGLQASLRAPQTIGDWTLWAVRSGADAAPPAVPPG
jgi:hypothetical protein